MFKEEAHKRIPKGSPEGGQFTSSDGAGGTHEATEAEKKRLKELGIHQSGAISTPNGSDYQLRNDGAKAYRQNTSYTEILSKDKKEALNTINPPQEIYGFEDKKKKNSPDHLQHAKEMGFKNQDEYEEAAVDFWENGQGEIYYGSKRGRFAKYNEKTGEYSVVDADGTLRTYYKLRKKLFEKKIKQEGYKIWKK